MTSLYLILKDRKMKETLKNVLFVLVVIGVVWGVRWLIVDYNKRMDYINNYYMCMYGDLSCDTSKL